MSENTNLPPWAGVKVVPSLLPSVPERSPLSLHAPGQAFPALRGAPGAAFPDMRDRQADHLVDGANRIK